MFGGSCQMHKKLPREEPGMFFEKRSQNKKQSSI